MVSQCEIFPAVCSLRNTGTRFVPAGKAMLFSHAMIGTNDVEKAKAFYDKVLGALGIIGSAIYEGRVTP